MFYEIVVAPKFTPEGLEVLKGKSKTLRILETEPSKRGRRSLRQVAGGWLLQEADDLTPDDIDFEVVTNKVPTLEQVEDAKFAWLCVKHVKSNAIVFAKVSWFSLLEGKAFSTEKRPGISACRTVYRKKNLKLTL